MILSGILAYHVQPYITVVIPSTKEAIPILQYSTLLMLWLPLWIGTDLALGLHCVFDRSPSGWTLFWGLLKLHGIFFLAISAISFATQLDVNRSLVFVFLSLCFLLMFLVRQSLAVRLKAQHKKGIAQKNILLVGDVGEAMKHYVKIASEQHFPPKIVGRLGLHMNSENGDQVELPLLGSVVELRTFLHNTPVDEVVFFDPFTSPSDNRPLLKACEELGIPACFSIGLDQPTQAAPRFAMQYDMPFVLFDVAPKRSDLLAVKHTFDVIAAFFLIVLLSPLMLITSLAILLSMGRPVLFFQKRAGRYGREFQMYKFRTMKNDAEGQRDQLLAQNEMSGPVFKVTRDPRVTMLGRLLRRSSIDEIPQLFNVLQGAMSLVGPRPLPVMEQQQIQGWRRRRLSMKPGITGIWQVSGRSNIDFERWMQMDLDYIDNWSLGLDISILLKTIFVVMRANGAK
ncbi:MAG: sugar transferase [Deltaproteobacteria bacterium]|nr:sugar transferase [Deltaproteobacteria bacterium]